MYGRTLLLLIALASPAASQQDSVDAFWSRLIDLADATAVREVVAQETGLNQSLALLRVYQITRESQAGSAAENSIQKQLSVEPRNAWLQFALGEVLAVRNARQFPLRASRYLLEALKLDAMHLPAATALARVALVSREATLLAEARRAGERIITERKNPELMTLLSEVAREERDFDRAEQRAAEALLVDAKTPRARYNLAIAQLADARTRDEGYRNYLVAAAERDPEVLRRVRLDLQTIGEPDEVPDFSDYSTNPGLQLERFWKLRSLRDGHTPAERVAEHYRRISHARDKFFAKIGSTFMEDALYWSEDKRLGYDDRGLIYIRYGEPSRVVGSIPASSNYFQTWIYELPGRERILFHFQLPPQAGRGYVISGIPRCGAWLSTHADLSGDYQNLAVKCGTGAPEWATQSVLDDMNNVYRGETELALRSDAFVPIYRNELAVDADAYAFRSADGAREFAIALAVPAVPALRRDNAYQFNLRLLVADTVIGLLQHYDSAVVFPTDRPLAKTDYLRTSTIVRLDRAHAPFFRTLVRSTADSTVGHSYYASLPIFLTTGFDVSDVVLAEVKDGGRFTRGPVQLQVMPSRVFADARFKVFYEIYGLEPGTDYQTTIRIEPKGGGVASALRKLTGQSAITLSFPGTVAGPERWRQQELRTIETSLAKGSYTLTVTVENTRTGAQAVKKREFHVVEN
ncbi:MAG: GWxTD domain-containing protein [Gemmatimonadota bacterium]